MDSKRIDDTKKKLLSITKQGAIDGLIQENQELIALVRQRGVYIWGTGLLGNFAYGECIKNGIKIHGYIDNNKNNLDDKKKVFPPSVLKADDAVIIASFHCVPIMEQLKNLGLKSYIYYENIALLIDGFATYYQAFQGIYEELEENKAEYAWLYDILADDLSKEIYTNILNYRMSLETKYTVDAFYLSLQHGSQYFDQIVREKAGKDIVFYDVGGFDGESTLDFIKYIGDYQKIYLFEPDKNIIEETKRRLQKEKNITFIQAGVGEKSSMAHYDALGKGAGNISDGGSEVIQLVALDDYIMGHGAYVKMDIEGYEMQALKGMKNAIIHYRPMLAVSVYHKCGDMHKLVKAILSWNPDYKVYMRHYTDTYADTVCYFIP